MSVKAPLAFCPKPLHSLHHIGARHQSCDRASISQVNDRPMRRMKDAFPDQIVYNEIAKKRTSRERTISTWKLGSRRANDCEGEIDLELTAMPYTIKLDIECDSCCRGSLIRLPDGIEASFNHTEGLLVLLEGIGGRRWWQENQSQIEARVSTLTGASI